MKTTHLLLLIVVFIALVLMVHYRKQSSMTTPPDKAGQGGAGLVVLAPKGFAADRVAEIALSRKEGDAVRLQKRDGRWVVASAWDVPADGDKVAALLKAVADLGGALRSEVSASHAKYGLDADGALRLTMGSSSGKDGAAMADLVDLYIGKTPSDLYNANYVRFADDDRSYVTTTLRGPTNLVDGAAPDRKFWLDTRIAQLDAAKINHIDLETPDHALTLVRGGAAAAVKSAVAPAAEPAPDQAETAAPADVAAKPVPAEGKPEGEPAPEAAVADAKPENAAETAETAAKPAMATEPEPEVKPEVAVVRTEPEKAADAVVAAVKPEEVKPEDEANREPTAAPVQPEVAAAEPAAAEVPADDAAWRVTRGGWSKASLRPEAVDAMVSAATRLEGVDVDDPSGPAAKALERPTWTWAAPGVGEGGAPFILGAVRDAGDGKLRVRANNRPGVVYVMSDDAWKRFFPSGGELFALEPARPDKAAVNHVEYQRGRHAFSFERQGEEAWKALVSPGFPARPEAVKGLLAAAGDWKPVDYADADADARDRFGFVEPRARATFVTPTGATVLALGGAAPNAGDYVDVGAKQALVAGAAESKRLFPTFAELFDLKLFAADAGAVEAVSVALDGKAARLLKFVRPPEGPQVEGAETKAEAAAWLYDGDQGVPVDGKAAAAARDKLLALSGDDLHKGPAEASTEWRDLKISLHTADGVVEAMFGPAEGEERLVKVAERVAVRLSSKEVAAFLEAFDALTPKPAPEAAPAVSEAEPKPENKPAAPSEAAPEAVPEAGKAPAAPNA